jgi:hypothetical protein
MVFLKGNKLGTMNKGIKRNRPAWNKGLKGWSIGTKAGFQKGHKAFKGTEKTRFKKGVKPWNIGKKWSEDIKKKMGRKGRHPKTEFKEGQFSKEKHWNWKKGITPEYTALISSKKWNKIRKNILNRDKFICQECNKYGDCVDHKIPWRISKDNSESNLRCLCRSCNSKKMIRDNKIW